LNFYSIHHFLVHNLPRESFLFYVSWYFILTLIAKAVVLVFTGYENHFGKAFLISLLSHSLFQAGFVIYVYSPLPKPFLFEVAFTLWLVYGVVLDFIIFMIFRFSIHCILTGLLAALTSNVLNGGILLLALMIFAALKF